MIFLTVSNPLPLAAREDSRVDSIRHVMNMDIRHSPNLEELSGKAATEVRLYTEKVRSRIVWRVKDNYFVYTVDSDQHLQSAALLFDQIHRCGIDTFVAERQYFQKERLRGFYHVRGVHIVCPLRNPGSMQHP